MEVAVQRFLDAFLDDSPAADILLNAASAAELSSIMSNMSRSQQSELASRLLKCIRALGSAEIDSPLRAAASILLLFLSDKKSPTPPDMRAAAKEMHDALPQISHGASRTTIVRVCETFWLDAREGREEIIENALIALIEKSLAEESGGVSAATDIKRIYALREAIRDGLYAKAFGDHVRALLTRCATSSMYLRMTEGQKFVAYLLANGMSEIHSALLAMLPCVRKSRANACGMVYVCAWKAMGSEPFMTYLEDITTKATRVAHDPLATNLRTVLASFHANKRIPGMDEMLHAIYTPIIFRALTVANPVVRRNSAIILADAFPVHDPGMSIVELEALLDSQCAKLYSLLEDPVPFVRVAAIEGVCRVLGLLWEIVPASSAKRMIELLTGSLAFDVTSANVRIAVCDGLRFMLDNHQTHTILSVTLRRLGSLASDKIERVRVAFLELLVALKSKRIVSARYFDIVPVKELIARLPVDSPAVSNRIMTLLVSSYFPLERKKKNRDEIAASQLRACVDLLKCGKKAATAFYSNLSMYIPPGPLVEFCIRVATLAMDADSRIERRAKSSNNKSYRKDCRTGDNSLDARQRDPRRDVPDHSGNAASGTFVESESEEDRKIKLLQVVANVLVSISPSLAKPVNEELNTCVAKIFGDASLKPLLTPGRNSMEMRLTAFKIAASMDAAAVQPVIDLWELEVISLAEKFCDCNDELSDDWIRQLIRCGLHWNRLDVLARLHSACTEMVLTGHRRNPVNRLPSKKLRRDLSQTASPGKIRVGALRALACFATLCAGDHEIADLLRKALDESNELLVPLSNESDVNSRIRRESVDRDEPPIIQVITSARKAVQNAFEVTVQCEDDVAATAAAGDVIAHCLSASLTLSTAISVDPPASHEERASYWACPVEREIMHVLLWLLSPAVLESVFDNSQTGRAMSIAFTTKVADCAGLGLFPVSEGIQLLARLCSEIAQKFNKPKTVTLENLQSEAEAYSAMEVVRFCYFVILQVDDAAKRLQEDGQSKSVLDNLHCVQELVESAFSTLGVYHVRMSDASTKLVETLSLRFSEFIALFARLGCPRQQEALGAMMAKDILKSMAREARHGDDIPLLVYFTTKAIMQRKPEEQDDGNLAESTSWIQSLFHTLASGDPRATLAVFRLFADIFASEPSADLSDRQIVASVFECMLLQIKRFRDHEVFGDDGTNSELESIDELVERLASGLRQTDDGIDATDRCFPGADTDIGRSEAAIEQA